MKRIPVISSSIASVGYENRTLEIAFVHGGVYQYFNVDEYVYQALMCAESKGRYFYYNIRNKYTFIRKLIQKL